MHYQHTIKDLSLHNMRLDKALSLIFKELSRSRLQTLITEGAVTVNGAPITLPKHPVKVEDFLELVVGEPVVATPKAESIELNVVYEDSFLLVIDKPAGLVVHSGAGHHEGTLVNALLGHCGDSLSGINGVMRPGIVHRLDKETSGLMVIAKNDEAHQGLVAQFQERTLKRTYMVFAFGCLSPLEGTIKTQIGRSHRNRQKMSVLAHGGKEAITHYKTEMTYGPSGSLPFASKIICSLETGRTHQIRVHLSDKGCPIIGDPLYGLKKPHKVFERLMDENEGTWDNKRQALHAFSLTFIHPNTKEVLLFSSPLPKDMEDLETLLEEGF